ncbi:hypothetical protein [Cryobacterium glaciale]|uniref:nucleotide-binding protein n=1 Tax=Cryobacterium glaciale TaxID=1259145 RepID=UPI001F53FB48|nr:hypothetical protein [Cryobacterium glaciale]
MSITTTVPLPEVRAVVTNTTVELNVLGNPETLTASTSAELRTKIMSRVVKLASGLGTDVRLEVHDHTGHWRLVASPNGHLREDEPLPPTAEEPAPVAQKIQPPSLPAEQLSAHLSEPTAAAAAAAAVSPLHDAPTAGASETAEDSGEELPTRKAARASFIIHERREPAATNGWRGLLARTTGLQVPASVLERERRRHVQAVSQHWPEPRKISVVNGKGGVGKTLTTAMLTAVFARNGGAGVLAWDNNDTRGTLGWRTEKGPPRRHRAGSPPGHREVAVTFGADLRSGTIRAPPDQRQVRRAALEPGAAGDQAAHHPGRLRCSARGGREVFSSGVLRLRKR